MWFISFIKSFTIFTFFIIIFINNVFAIPYKDLALKNRKGILQKILKQREIVVGIQENLFPFSTKNPEYPGIDIEIIQLLSKTLDVNYKIVYGNIEQLVELTSNKKIDIAFGGISIGVYRSLAVNFSYPYIISTPAGLLNKNKLPRESLSVDFPKTKIKNIGDIVNLPKLKIAIKENTIYEKLLTENEEFNRHEIKTYPSNEEALESIINGENDLFVSDKLQIIGYLIQKKELKERFHPLLNEYIQEYISAMVPPDDLEFLLFINTFIQDLERKGIIKKILTKYLETSNWID